MSEIKNRSISGAFSSGHIEINSDAYEDLRNATPEELLAAAVWSIRQSAGTKAVIDQCVSYLCAGFQLAQPGGWERIAPWWLRESRQQNKEEVQ